MAGNEGRYVDIRSSGKGVIGRVHENKDGSAMVTPIKAPTRAHLIKEIRKKYSVGTDVVFNRRGKTVF